jgi:predicted nucleic acid-binding protein
VVLPDTSVWVDFARRGAKGRAAALHEFLERGDVATCGPVAAELLAGADGEVADRISATLKSLPWAGLDQAGWHEVGAVASRLRGKGQTLPLTDLAIAVATARAGHVLWSFDSDFDRIHPVVDGLEIYAAKPV